MDRIRIFTIALVLFPSVAFAQKQVVNNGETMRRARTKINSNFTELYNKIQTDVPSGAIFTDDQTASEVSTSTTNFNKNLSGTDDTVQKALDTLDNMNLSGGSMTYPGAGIPNSTGSAWGTSYTLSSLASALDGEAWVFTGSVDFTGASSISIGPLEFVNTDSSPPSVGRFLYDNTVTGLSGGAMEYHNGTSVKYLLDSDTLPANNGEVPTYDATNDKLIWSIPSGGGSFAFDTFPEYEDSAHSSGLAVNNTTLAVWSAGANKWLTVALADTLDPTPVAGPCPSQSILVEQLSGGASGNNISGNDAEGQGIVFATNEDIYSVTVKVNHAYSTSPVKMRFGTTTDLSTTYLAESAQVDLSVDGDEYEFIFDSPIPVTAGTQYYWVISNMQGVYYFSLERATSDVVSGQNRVFGGSQVFNASSNTSTEDYYYRVKKCVQ